jgi:DNA-binding MarR family transcriptional regulator
MAVVTSVMRVEQLLLARIEEVLKPTGLSFARYELLMLLTFSRVGSLPLGKIGARLQVDPASVTNLINRLERDGLVRRQPHPTDGRTTLAEITPEGRSLAQRATAALNAGVFEAIDLTRREMEDLFGLLRKVRAAAGDFIPSEQAAGRR